MHGAFRVLPAILLLGAFAAVTGWDLDGSFYWDEAVYADLAQHPLRSDFYATSEAIFTRHPPLYPLLLNGLARLPFDLEVTARAAGIAFAVAGLALVFGALAGAGRRRTALAVLALGCANTLVQQYAQSASMYAPLLFFHALLAWGWTRRNAAAQVVGMVGGLYTNYLAVFAIAAVAVLDAIEHRRTGDRLWIRKYALVGLLYLPWLAFLLPGLWYHRSKFEGFFLHWNLWNVVATLGIGGVALLAIWVRATVSGGLGHLADRIRGTAQERLEIVALATQVFLLAGVLGGRPFLRYLAFTLPVTIAGLALVAQRLARNRMPLRPRRQALFLAGVLALTLVPNPEIVGVFPWSFSIHDPHDSIHHEDCREIAAVVGNAPVTVENVRSYFYYLRESRPDLAGDPFPWEDRGIHELAYDPTDLDETLEHAGQVDTPFVAFSLLGRGKDALLRALTLRGYEPVAWPGNSVVLALRKRHSRGNAPETGGQERWTARLPRDLAHVF